MLVLLHSLLLLMNIFVVSSNATDNESITIVPTSRIVQQVNDQLVFPLPPPGSKYGPFPYMHHPKIAIPVDDLKNNTLRMLVTDIEPPYVNYVNFTDEAAREHGYGPGVVIQILKEIGELLNLTYKEVPYTEKQWGVFDNGSWSGAFGVLASGKVDVIAGAAIMQYDRSLIADLTYPFEYERTGILIKAPGKFEDRPMLIVTAPFKWQVWLTIGLCIIASAVIFLGETRILERFKDELHVNYFGSIWIFYSVFVQQGLPNQPRTWSCRCLLAFWWLASITLMATFTGSLVALFAVDQMALPFKDLDGMVKVVKQGHYKILMDANSLTRTEMIAKSALPAYKDLWYEMSVNNKAVYVKGVDSAVELLRNSTGLILLGPWSSLSFYAFSDCDLYMFDFGILPVYLSIALALNSPYSTYFSTVIQGMVERGFVKKWTSDYTSYVYSQKSLQCNQTVGGSRSYLDLNRAQGAFWILLGGLGVSAIFLVIEFLLTYLERKDITNWSLSSVLATEIRPQPRPSPISQSTAISEAPDEFEEHSAHEASSSSPQSNSSTTSQELRRRREIVAEIPPPDPGSDRDE